MHLNRRRYLKVVGLVGIVQVDLLLEQGQRVPDEEVSDVLGQEVIDTCEDRPHRTD